jgi:predicted phosphodiesterase
VMAGGHTHEQFVRRWGESVVLNAGSVGLAYEAAAGSAPRNPPWAEYAIVTSNGDALRVELRRVALDAWEQHDAVLKSGMPHSAWWAAYRY